MHGSGEGWRGARRGRLLEAAGRVFARQAYAQASMDEIAHEAGVGKPTLYRYFPSKEALFAAVFGRALDELEDRLEAVLAGRGGVAAQLHGLVAAMVPTVRDHLVSLRFLGEDGALADQSKRRVFRERRARIAGYLQRALEGGIACGEVRAMDAARTANYIIGMVWSGSAVTRAEDDDALARELAGIILNGVLRPEPAGARTGDTRTAGTRTGAAILRGRFPPLPSDPERDGMKPTHVRPREATS